MFPVVFGKPSTPTPVGRFAVYSKTAGPNAAFGPLVLWYHRGYGIHGTNQEYLLSRPSRYYRHGCTVTTTRTSSGCGHGCPSAPPCSIWRAAAPGRRPCGPGC